MPSSLVVVALVLAWLLVLVPMIVRKRQEVAKTADSELAARVVRSGSGESDEFGDEEAAMRDTDGIDEDFGADVPESDDVVHDGAAVDDNDVDDARRMPPMTPMVRT